MKDAGENGFAGWTVFDDLNNDGVLQGPSTASFDSSDVPKAIPDQKTITSTTTVSGVLGPISDVNVKLTIHHTFDRDLVITLIAPDGTKVTLASRNGSSADNFINTVFDDQANISITSGSAPFTGTFRPVGLLANLNGKNANGIWTLQVADVTRQDSGTLDSWSLSIATAGEPSETTDTSGDYQFVDVPPGDHHIREIPQTGFVQTSPVGGMYNVIMATGSQVSNQDFGNAPVQPMVVPTVLGDFNQDGKTTGDDVPALILALTDPETYKATYNVTDASLLTFGDLDGDHAVTNADLQALLTLLNSGNSGGNPAAIATAAPSISVATIVAPSVSAPLVVPSESRPESQAIFSLPQGASVRVRPTRIPSIHSRAIDEVLSHTGAFRGRHFRGRLEEPTAFHFGPLLG